MLSRTHAGHMKAGVILIRERKVVQVADSSSSKTMSMLQGIMWP